jgi:hypothetical protein
MKLKTTFWSEQEYEFDKLFYINGKTKEIVFQTSLDDAFETFCFFKSIARFVKSKKVLDTVAGNYDDRGDFYQFATIKDDEILHIKWFDLVMDDKLTISHDIAFETTLIKKNNQPIPLGKFPHWNKSNKNLPKYREFNLKARAYKYMANQVAKNTL